MDFLKRIWEEIVATVKPTLVLFVSLIFWILNKITHLPRIIYWLILFPLSIGLCLYLSFFSITFIKGQRPWSSLSTPPDMPTEIVAANHTDILVKTSNGKYYKCTYERDGSKPSIDNFTNSDINNRRIRSTQFCLKQAVKQVWQ